MASIRKRKGKYQVQVRIRGKGTSATFQTLDLARRWARSKEIEFEKNIKVGKAGRNRWKGKRPQSRGVAMNPVDHPHGGGEGKTSGGRSPVSPWGQSAKGLKTRRPKRSDKLIITRRKKRK